ncbi:translation initiation factor IF-3 [Elusimicrobiota bacterium]
MKTKDNQRLRVNEQIKSPQVMVIDSEGGNVGMLAVNVAIEKAKEKELDLVEVAPEAKPPVCKIMDYSRYYYKQQKKRRENKRKSKAAHLKQMRLSPNIGKNDLQTKFRRIKEFLEEGHKVKINMRFRGREREHLEVGREILDGVIKQLEGIARYQDAPKFEGYYMSVMMIPEKEHKQ